MRSLKITKDDGQGKNFEETAQLCGLKKKENNLENFEGYSEAIETVSKVLGCFEDDLRIPVLGLGARLWPLHCIVSHCFALNSNIFNPLFASADEIKLKLEESLREKRVVPQGPVVFSEVLKFACDFARFCKENDSRYYVVLVIMTCKDVADVEAFKKELERSHKYPLSVIVCRVVPLKKTSTTMNALGSVRPTLKRPQMTKTLGEKETGGETEVDEHNEPRNNESQHQERFLRIYNQISICRSGRDMLHAFCVGEKQKLELTSTARKVLQKLPKQFVEYMEKENKKPKLQEDGVQNERIKQLKKELINKMANRKKNLDRENCLIGRFLKMQQEEFLKEVKSIGFTGQTVEEIICGKSTLNAKQQSDQNEDISEQFANIHLKDFENQVNKSEQENDSGLETHPSKKVNQMISRRNAKTISHQEGVSKMTNGSLKEKGQNISLAARDLNLLSELVGYVKNSRSLNKKQPIKLEELGWEKERMKQLRTLQSVREDLVKIARASFNNSEEESKENNELGRFEKTGMHPEQMQNTQRAKTNQILRPREETVFTREDNNNINSKWKQRQKDMFEVTQNFLRGLEQKEIRFQEENYPNEIYQRIKKGYHKCGKGEEIEKSNQQKSKTGVRDSVYQEVIRKVKLYYNRKNGSERRGRGDRQRREGAEEGIQGMDELGLGLCGEKVKEKEVRKMMGMLESESAGVSDFEDDRSGNSEGSEYDELESSAEVLNSDDEVYVNLDTEEPRFSYQRSPKLTAVTESRSMTPGKSMTQSDSNESDLISDEEFNRKFGIDVKKQASEKKLSRSHHDSLHSEIQRRFNFE